jgi:hypothetical protein
VVGNFYCFSSIDYSDFNTTTKILSSTIDPEDEKANKYPMVVDLSKPITVTMLDYLLNKLNKEDLDQV